METLLNICTCCNILSVMWTMTAAAIIGMLILKGIPRPIIGIMQLLITAAIWTYALTAWFSDSTGQVWSVPVVLLGGGAVSAVMTKRLDLKSGAGAGRIALIAMFVLLACVIVWAKNILTVLIGCVVNFFRLPGLQKIKAVAILLLLLLPVGAISAKLPPQYNIIRNELVRPLYTDVIAGNARKIVDKTRSKTESATKDSDVRVQGISLSGNGGTFSFCQSEALSAKDLAVLSGTGLMEEKAIKEAPILILYTNVFTAYDGEAMEICWVLANENVYDDIYTICVGDKPVAKSRKLNDGDAIILRSASSGEELARVRVGIFK